MNLDRRAFLIALLAPLAAGLSKIGYRPDPKLKRLEVYESPDPKAEYCMGVDVAEGIGRDSSVISVIRIGYGESPDTQVAYLADNTVEPIVLAEIADVLGRYYNDALMAVEVNGVGRVPLDYLRLKLRYPNLYKQATLARRPTAPLVKREGWRSTVRSVRLLDFFHAKCPAIWLRGGDERASKIALFCAHEISA